MIIPLCKINKDVYVLCVSGVLLVGLQVCLEAKTIDFKQGNTKSNSSLCSRCQMKFWINRFAYLVGIIFSNQNNLWVLILEAHCRAWGSTMQCLLWAANFELQSLSCKFFPKQIFFSLVLFTQSLIIINKSMEESTAPHTFFWLFLPALIP